MTPMYYRSANMTLPSLMGLGRLGTQTTSSEISSGVAAAGATVGAAASAGLLLSIGISAAVVPFIGPIVAGITLLIAGLGIGNGCGQSCILASNDANQAEALMAQNAEAAQQQAVANGGCLTADEQALALQNFDQLWAALVNACNNPQLGDPGQRCISERQRGGQYDYFAAHRDPISALPICSTSDQISQLVSGLPVWLGPALIIGAAMLMH